MTWLWRIFFSGVMALPLVASTVRGRIELVGSRDPGVRKHKDYSGVVVWLEPLGNWAAQTVAPPPPVQAEMAQKDKTFQPHVLAIPLGSTVSFPNFDPVFHNAFSNFNGQIFDVGLYRPGSSRTVRFELPGVVRVFCNIHPRMSAVIVVLKNRYFGVSTKTGAFEIPGAPAGEYQLHIFHERASEESLQFLERRIIVESAALELPVIPISESGYLQAPHKNKYGQDYPPASEDHRVYPGAPK